MGYQRVFLCRESGMPYDFLPYQGKTTKLPEKYNHFGFSGGLVMSLLEDRVRLTATTPCFLTIISLLQVWLSLPIKPNLELVKQGRGVMDGCTSNNKKLWLVRGNDNSLLTVLLSDYDWKTNQGQVEVMINPPRSMYMLPAHHPYWSTIKV